GLGNRRSATDLVERLWRDPTIPKTSIAFIMADIDLFKLLNDTTGHAAGEEFFIVLANASPDLAWTIAERIRTAVEALAIVNPGVDPTGDSRGTVTISRGGGFARGAAARETC